MLRQIYNIHTKTRIVYTTLHNANVFGFAAVAAGVYARRQILVLSMYTAPQSESPALPAGLACARVSVVFIPSSSIFHF